MKFIVVSSGSKGNATLVFSKGHVIQLDFGVSKRKITQALKEENFSFDDIDAFLITHEHSDHCSDIFNADKNKVYASNPYLPNFDGVISNNHLLIPFKELYIGSFKIIPIPLSHDAKNTVGFIIKDDESLAYITDTGFIPEKDSNYLTNLNYYIFESNHDPKMLYESNRPDYLIRRIISDTGHLSNTDSSLYLSTFIGEDTKEIVLAHLSDECNKEDIALDTYKKIMLTQLGYIPDIKVTCASDKHITKGGK